MLTFDELIPTFLLISTPTRPVVEYFDDAVDIQCDKEALLCLIDLLRQHHSSRQLQILQFLSSTDSCAHYTNELIMCRLQHFDVSDVLEHINFKMRSSPSDFMTDIGLLVSDVSGAQVEHADDEVSEIGLMYRMSQQETCNFHFTSDVEMHDFSHQVYSSYNSIDSS